MVRKTISCFALLLLLFLGNSAVSSGPKTQPKNQDEQTSTLERMVVANGTVTVRLNVDRLNGIRSEALDSKPELFQFQISPDSFFSIRVLNDVLRAPEPGTIGLIGNSPGILPQLLAGSSTQLEIEKLSAGEPNDLILRDGKTGFIFFKIEGETYEYNPLSRSLTINGGRLIISDQLASKLEKGVDSGVVVGQIDVTAIVYPIEVTTLVNDTIKSSTMPPRKGNSPDARSQGPDIVVGDMTGLAQFGSASGQVGLGIGTTSCNNGDQPVHFFQLPNTDHSVVSQNLYRMSGGATNDERFEQIGEAWVKHTFGADQNDACSFGCTPWPDATQLGVGCSDPYSASQNASQTDHAGALGSRAWVNAFTGAFPSNPRPENHAGHVHTGTSHRILVNASDLDTTQNAGATYYAEVQYDSPHEYAWCQAHAGQCNMYNNASYRRYNVSGTTSFTFASVGSTVRMTPATAAWTGATSSTIEPEPGVDGRAFVVYKVSGPIGGVWHYEYGIHNQNLDRSIQSFNVPLGCGVNISNIAFHAPPNHPGFPNDGTVGNTGFSNTPWTVTQAVTNIVWETEKIEQNPNANAIRFGTMYNFRFDSDRPPQAALASVGFFKTGSPITVAIQAPAPDVCVPTTPTPTPSPTATPTPTLTPTPPPTILISGTIFYCSNPSPAPVADVTLGLTGSTSTSTQSDGSGNYQFSSLASGGSFVVTPSKVGLPPGSPGISTVDVVAIQRHFLGIASLPPGCRQTAADVNGDSAINTIDVIASQQFFLGSTTGVANVGKYKFTPVNRSYTGVTTNQTGQNYDALVFGDVVSPFVDAPK